MSLLIESLDENVDAVELVVDERNDMSFNVQIEGVSGKATCRLVVETSENVGQVFAGEVEENVAKFSIAENTLRVGEFPAQFEVFVEGRHFVPVKFFVTVKSAPKVIVAKPIVEQTKSKKPVVSATLSLAEKYKMKKKA